MNQIATMNSPQDAQRRNLRVGLALGMLALLYIAAVIAFIIVY
ncbi:MAG TPA: hypothetical protein VEI95_17970 [Acidobacteriota bacterium]|nr:hypothetical protein [Acidobacteriota bacterium]